MRPASRDRRRGTLVRSWEGGLQLPSSQIRILCARVSTPQKNSTCNYIQQSPAQAGPGRPDSAAGPLRETPLVETPLVRSDAESASALLWHRDCGAGSPNRVPGTRASDPGLLRSPPPHPGISESGKHSPTARQTGSSSLKMSPHTTSEAIASVRRVGAEGR